MTKLENIYRQYYHPAKKEMRKFGCSDFAFDDLYQEAFRVLLENEKANGTEILFPYAFIIRICKNRWFRELKTQNRQVHNQDLDNFETSVEEPVKDLKHMILFHMKRLSESCQQALRLFCQNCSEEEIAGFLNLAGPKAAKNKKYYCKEKLYNRIINDPYFKILYG